MEVWLPDFCEAKYKRKWSQGRNWVKDALIPLPLQCWDWLLTTRLLTSVTMQMDMSAGTEELAWTLFFSGFITPQVIRGLPSHLHGP